MEEREAKAGERKWRDEQHNQVVLTKETVLLAEEAKPRQQQDQLRANENSRLRGEAHEEAIGRKVAECCNRSRMQPEPTQAKAEQLPETGTPPPTMPQPKEEQQEVQSAPTQLQLHVVSTKPGKPRKNHHSAVGRTANPLTTSWRPPTRQRACWLAPKGASKDPLHPLQRIDGVLGSSPVAMNSTKWPSG